MDLQIYSLLKHSQQLIIYTFEYLNSFDEQMSKIHVS